MTTLPWKESSRTIQTAAVPRRPQELGSLQDRVKAGLNTVTVELAPPRVNCSLDERRHEREVKHYTELMARGVIDGITIRDAPSFRSWHEWLARRIKRWPDFRSQWLADLQLLVTEVQARVEPLSLEPPENYVATIAAQTWSEDTIRQKILRATTELSATAVFFPSGGDPRRRLAGWIERTLWSPLATLLRRVSPLYLAAPLDAVRMTTLAKDLQREGRVPEHVQFWAVWDHAREPSLADGRIDTERGLAWLQRKIEAGVSVVLTQPPFLRRNFMDWLYHMHREGITDRVQIKIGVPYISSAANLRFWLRLVRIDPRKEQEAQSLLDDWTRAEEMGRLKSFRREWNRNFMSWVLELPVPTGFHYMPTLPKEGTEVLTEVIGDAHSRIDSDRRLPGRKQLTTFVRNLTRLRWPVRVSFSRILESHRETPSGTVYMQEVAPFLEVITSVLGELQEETGVDHAAFWKGLRVYLYRIKFVHSARAPIVFREADDGWREVAINIRAFSKSRASEEEGKKRLRRDLESALGRFMSGHPTGCDAIFLEDASARRSDANSALQLIASEGYRIIRQAVHGDEEQSTKLASSALNPGLITHHVDVLLESLDQVDETDLVYLEPGIWEANGIPEFLEALAARANAKQEEKLRSVTYVLSDFKEEAIRSAREALGDQHERLGIRFVYLLLDANRNPLQSYRQRGYEGRVIGGRAINLLDAVGTNYVAQYDGRSYTISARTYLPVDKARRLAQKEVEIQVDGTSRRCRYADYGVTPEHLQAHLPRIRDEGVLAFFDHYRREHGMPESVLIQFWKDLFLLLEQKHAYHHSPEFEGYAWTEIPGIEANKILSAVNRSHPGNHWIPDSGLALRVVQGLVPLLHPAGQFLFTQLTTDLQAIHHDFEALRQMGVTVATPILREVFERAGSAAGYEVETVSAERSGGRATSVVIAFRSGPP